MTSLLKRLLGLSQNSQVLMLKSVGQYPAGQKVQIPALEADRFIIRGYADGRLSREYTDEERNALKGTNQIVRV